MTCNACGEKPKKTCNDFTKAVIEIDNPETLVLLRKVVIPAAMGTEEQVPAAIGKYHNVVLKYEANNHVYLYSSDGIPTLLEMDVPQEVWDSIDELQEEIDEMKNNPDVVDIVDTYADLESYDTSELGDKDVIRVLNDETHDGESTYYRWNLSSQTWTFIGGLGPYYTKDETDALIESARKTWVGNETTASSSGSVAEVTTTSGDFVWNEGHTVTVNFKYKASRSSLKIDSGSTYDIDSVRSFSGGIDSGVAIQYACVIVSGQRMYRPIGRLRASSDVAGPVFIANNLTSGNVGLTALSAYQGKVLKDMIDALPSIPTVVQATGDSTTDVMSQNAVTSMVYYDPATKKNIVIGGGTIGSSNEVVAVGRLASVRGDRAVAIGSDAGSQVTNAPGGISLGAFSKAAGQGQMDIGLTTAIPQSQAVYGYNGSAYRLLTGLYDPQSAHDAATKGYVDSLIATLEARIAALENT